MNILNASKKILLSVIAIVAFSWGTRASAQQAAFDVGAFLPFWGIPEYQNYNYANIDTLYIHAIATKASVMSDYGLIFKDPNGSDPYAQPDLAGIIQYVRSVNPEIKVILSIADFHKTDSIRQESLQLFKSANSSQTIDYLLQNYIVEFGFDGLALDIEDKSLVYLGTDYGKFVSAMSQRLHDEQAMGERKTSLVFLGNGDYHEPYVDGNVINSVDYVGVMDYGAEKMDYLIANPNRDLAAAASNWSTKISRSKLMFGLAGWGQYINPDGTHYKPGLAYRKILELSEWDATMGPLLTTTFHVDPADTSLPSGTKQRYNSLFEYRRKTEFSYYGNYGGVFFWDITKDSNDPVSSALRYIRGSVDSWRSGAGAEPRVVGVTDRDFYSSQQQLLGKFHSLQPSVLNWVGIYNYETGAPTGRFQYLPSSGSGNFTFTSSTIQSLEPGTLYILRFYNGAGGIGQTLLGTSHPFYRL